MPTVFRRLDDQWKPESLSSVESVLVFEPLSAAASSTVSAKLPQSCVITRAGASGSWVLLGRPDQHLVHNGATCLAGMRVLEHQDCIALEGFETVYFSTEEELRIEPFTASAEASCPRCRRAILPGDPAVKCPSCGVFHHEMADSNCWTYAPTCALCQRQTQLDAGLQWSPAAL